VKYRKKSDLGSSVYFIYDSDALDILKTMSKKTWIIEVPNLLVELINSNFDIALESVDYVPNLYFKLNDKFRNDKKLISATIRSFRKYNRINEINIKTKPLSKKVNR